VQDEDAGEMNCRLAGCQKRRVSLQGLEGERKANATISGIVPRTKVWSSRQSKGINDRENRKGSCVRRRLSDE